MTRTKPNSSLDEKIRVYAVPEKGNRNYFQCNTTLGPMFGGTKENAAVMTRMEFMSISRDWPMGCMWEIEEVE